MLLAAAPAWVLAFFLLDETDSRTRWPWIAVGIILGLFALAAAWFGGEWFVLRQVRKLSSAARQLALGDLGSRTGLADDTSELGDLGRSFDSMAETLEQRERERQRAETSLLNRSLQQMVASALGQFALLTTDLESLLNQAALMIPQTLGVEYCAILQFEPGGRLRLEAGVGWREPAVGKPEFTPALDTEHGVALGAREPLVIEDLAADRRFKPSPFLLEHGVVSGIVMAIAGQGEAFGVVGAYTTHRRVFTEDEAHFIMAVATVLALAAARNRSAAQLEQLAAFARLNPNPAMELTSSGALTYCNEAAEKLANLLGQSSPSGILPANINNVVQTCLADQPGRVSLETKMQGRILTWSFHPVAARQVVHAYIDDVTERLSLEAQLRQAQKMESVGQLAAGVAHDFNNMLTIIQGHAGALVAKSSSQTPLSDSAQAIFFAAERAASLTRQLLMFSRKNVMQPRLLDLREVVSHMSKMLQRLLGETVRLEFVLPAEIPMIHADVGMVEQVIMNLAVNARDAMPNGGTLLITAAPAAVSQEAPRSHPEARPGSFVRLMVTDNGCGMSPETMARIFEPFFTTKEVGKGTGLGLATVYGIVKQHQGWIEVRSGPGQGTTFSIFFPASGRPVESRQVEAQSEIVPAGGTETILLVEDEPVLRDMARVFLEERGYHVLEAGSGREALAVWEKHRDAIDLMLTDMAMPEGISGTDLARQLVARKPTLKVVFASGYSMEDLDTAFIRKGQAAFLSKPYDHRTLTHTVRQCLDTAVPRE